MKELSHLQAHLNSLRKEDWAKLFDLMEDIRMEGHFGQLKGGQILENGILSFPFWEPTEIVLKFLKTVYELEIVPVFDWSGWGEGSEILNNDQQDYQTLDPVTLCKLLTVIIRKDRFDDGYMIICFKRGILFKILDSLKQKVH